MTNKVLMIIFFGAITACTSQPVKDAGGDVNSLLVADRLFSEYVSRHGIAEAFQYYLAEDALLLSNRAPTVQGKSNIYQTMLASNGLYTLNWQPLTSDISSSGDLGYTSGRFTMTDIRTKEARSGKYVNIWKKNSQGAWKLSLNMGNQ